MQYVVAVLFISLIAFALYEAYKLGIDNGYIKGYSEGCDEAAEIGVQCMDDMTKRFIDYIQRHDSN